MAEPEGNFSNTFIEFTSSDGINTNVLVTATTNNFTYTGTTGATDEVVVSGVADPIVANDSANKRYIDTLFYDIVLSPGAGVISSALANTNNVNIFLQEGTYTETVDLDLPASVYLVGENKHTTIIDFGTNDVGMILDGGGTPAVGGTISIPNGSTTVTGVGTSFDTALVVGEYILLQETFYEIDSITSATVLDIVDTYNGVTLTTEAYVGLPLVSGTFRNFTLQASGSGTASLLNLSSTISVFVENVCFINSRNHAIAFNNQVALASSTQTLIQSCIIDSPDSDGINIPLEFQGNIVQTIIKNVGNLGIDINLCRNLVVNGLNITNCDSDGIFIENVLTNEIVISDTISDNNNGNGINIDSTSVGIVIQGCSCTGNGTNGILLSGSNNTISGCTLDNNTTDGISIAGTSDSNTITTNQITGNGVYGVDIVSGAVDNIINSNMISGNTTGQINNSDGTSTANSMFTGNVVAGVKDNALFFAYDNTGGLAISSTLQTLPYDTTSTINEIGYSLDTVTNIGEITFTLAGNYEVDYWVQCESLNASGVPRTALSAELQVNGTQVPGSVSSAYIREQGTTGIIAYGCGKTVPISASASDVVRVQFQKGPQTTTAQTRAGESSIYIKRLGS